MFFRGSRYEHIAEASIDGSGRADDPLQAHALHPGRHRRRCSLKVHEGDRPDLVAFRALGDPEQFWRLCDVNLVRRPGRS